MGQLLFDALFEAGTLADRRGVRRLGPWLIKCRSVISGALICLDLPWAGGGLRQLGPRLASLPGGMDPRLSSESRRPRPCREATSELSRPWRRPHQAPAHSIAMP